MRPAKPRSANALAHRAARRFKSMITAAWGERIRDVRVFGSMARDDAHEGSDLDILVLVDVWEPEIQRGIAFAALDVVDELDLPYIICPLIMSQAHFEDLRHTDRLLAREVDAHGVAV